MEQGTKEEIARLGIEGAAMFGPPTPSPFTCAMQAKNDFFGQVHVMYSIMFAFVGYTKTWLQRSCLMSRGF